MSVVEFKLFGNKKILHNAEKWNGKENCVIKIKFFEKFSHFNQGNFYYYEITTFKLIEKWKDLFIKLNSSV